MSSFPIFGHLGPAVRYRITSRGSSGVWNRWIKVGVTMYLQSTFMNLTL